jgi:hypothetical protein
MQSYEINTYLKVYSKLLVNNFYFLSIFFIIFVLNFKELLLIKKNGCQKNIVYYFGNFTISS